MFCDLNIPFTVGAGTDGSTAALLKERLLMAQKLGYQAVCLNREIEGKCRPEDLRETSLSMSGLPEDLKLYSRVTLTTEDSVQALEGVRALSQAHASSSASSPFLYDIIAVRPLSDKVFQQCCSSLPVHIISLDLSKRLAIKLKPALLKEALDRGTVFEITYSAALRGAVARRNLFCNAQLLSRALYGRGVIIASGAHTAMELRGPYDVANLASLFGLSQDAAKYGITRLPEEVLSKATARRMNVSQEGAISNIVIPYA